MYIYRLIIKWHLCRWLLAGEYIVIPWKTHPRPLRSVASIQWDKLLISVRGVGDTLQLTLLRCTGTRNQQYVCTWCATLMVELRQIMWLTYWLCRLPQWRKYDESSSHYLWQGYLQSRMGYVSLTARHQPMRVKYFYWQTRFAIWSKR